MSVDVFGLGIKEVSHVWIDKFEVLTRRKSNFGIEGFTHILDAKSPIPM